MYYIYNILPLLLKGTKSLYCNALCVLILLILTSIGGAEVPVLSCRGCCGAVLWLKEVLFCSNFPHYLLLVLKPVLLYNIEKVPTNITQRQLCYPVLTFHLHST